MLPTYTLLCILLATIAVQALPHAPANLWRRDDDAQIYDMTDHYSARAGWTNANASVLSIHGEVRLPWIRTPDGGNNDSVSVWVQIDGDSCLSDALMAGIDMTRVNDQDMAYEAWWAGYPSPGKTRFNQTIDGCDPDNDFRVDETVHLMVDTSDAAEIRLMVNNCTHSILAKPLDAALCSKDASWHLGRTDNNGTGLVVSDSNDLEFTSAFATFAYDTLGTDGAGSVNTTNGTATATVGLDGITPADSPHPGMRIVNPAYSHTITKHDITVSCGFGSDPTTVTCHQKDAAGDSGTS
ncbi:unnamed protein product [Peniophora sp. CBMAI 1063]|nr:unnamed protein product [Peniophora sp. CBMAI 1063]